MINFDTNRWKTPAQFILNVLGMIDPLQSMTWIDCAADHENFDAELFEDYYGPREADGPPLVERRLDSETLGWLNPPYGGNPPIIEWVRWAAREAFESRATVACLLPNSTDTLWWELTVRRATAVYFIQGRIAFERPDDDGVWRPAGNSRQPNILAIFAPSRPAFPGEMPFFGLMDTSGRPLKAADE